MYNIGKQQTNMTSKGKDTWSSKNIRTALRFQGPLNWWQQPIIGSHCKHKVTEKSSFYYYITSSTKST